VSLVAPIHSELSLLVTDGTEIYKSYIDRS